MKTLKIILKMTIPQRNALIKAIPKKYVDKVNV